jgi:hypothetical protein
MKTHHTLLTLMTLSLSGTAVFAAETGEKISPPASPATNSTASLSIADYTTFRFGDAISAKFNALVQGWSVSNETTTANDQSLRLRRAELKLSGAVMNAPKYFFMVDPAKLIVAPNAKPIAASNMIQDFGISYAFAPGFEITVGQFKTPTTAEGLDPASDLPLPERSLIGRTVGDKREMGVKAGFKAAMWNATTMVSSGRYLTAAGEGMFHDLDTRVEITPMKGASIGSFLVLGNNFDYDRKGRWGANGRYTIGSAVLRAEYAQAKDAAVQSHGVTTEVGYWINDNLQPIARYETYSPNQAATASGRAETLGVNYYIRSYFAKLQVAASALQNMAAVNGSPAFVQGANNKEITVALQVAI